MKGVERVPFAGDHFRLGRTDSTDSTVMLIHNETLITDKVLKWNKCFINDVGDAINIVNFAQKSINLYSSTIGEEHILPTQFVIGEKKDHQKIKLKVYEVQDYVSGWTGQSLPEDLHRDPLILENWRKLYSRLSILYLAGDVVNRKIKIEGRSEFPIKLTTGVSTRRAALSRDNSAYNQLPRTPNILISRKDLSLKIGDFGEYTIWNENMEVAYNEIYTRAKRAINSIEGLI